MKYLTLAIPVAISLALYLLIYRPVLVADKDLSRVRFVEMLHLHVFVWWNAFLYPLFSLICAFSDLSKTKVILKSGLGIVLISMILGFASGVVFAKQAWGIYFAADIRSVLAVANLLVVQVVFDWSRSADQEKPLQVKVILGLVLAICTMIGNHLVGYVIPSTHPNSAFWNIISQ